MPVVDHFQKNYSLSFGKAGTNWFYSFLHKNGILDEDDFNILASDIDRLITASINELKQNNYDFLHGAIGIAYCLLYAENKPNTKAFKDFFDSLKNLMSKGNRMFGNVNVSDGSLIPNEVNIGLAHGIPSILKFCIECFKRSVCRDEAQRLAESIMEYLILNCKNDISDSYYPYVIGVGKNENHSRLAWCYGDLTIAYILYQSGNIFSNQRTIDFSLKVLEESTRRKTVQETQIIDAAICHGSAGAAHVYNRMWQYTGKLIFKSATDYWIQKTLDFSTHLDGVAGYKMYNAKSANWEKDHGLLEGAAGIGLVLLSYLTGDFSWDYCLMLND